MEDSFVPSESSADPPTSDRGIKRAGSNTFTQLLREKTVCHPDVIVRASLKDLCAHLVLASSKGYLATVEANGEGFRTIGQSPEMEMR
jgi:hypothetical protein